MSSTGLYAVVPAAGSGRRFGAPQPKQYSPFAGATVLGCTLERLRTIEGLDGIVVALDADDSHWAALLEPDFPDVITVNGGRSRAHSVLNALRWLEQEGAHTAWALVHDSVRPCVPDADLNRLLACRDGDASGALLVRSLDDTIKRIDGERVLHTEDRTQLRAALTPQLFRVAELATALAETLAEGVEITDESMAIERAGGSVRCIAGDPRNIKITRSFDLAIAEIYFRQIVDGESSQCA